jgi:hypothetical protein
MPEDAASMALTAYEVTVRPAPLPGDSAAADSSSSTSQADEQPEDPCSVSATLWLPAKPAPAKETP